MLAPGAGRTWAKRAAPSLALSAIGCGQALRSLPAVAPQHMAAVAGETQSGARALYLRPGLHEWYENRPDGLEQGFTLSQPPCGVGQGIALAVTLRNTQPTLTGQAVEFCDSDHRVCYRYGKLSAFDATGRKLPAELSLTGQTVRLSIDDTDARYPVTVDPLVWIYSHALVASDASKDALLGAAVAMSGDTVVAGAPGATVGGMTEAGAAYVFTRGTGLFSQEGKLVASDASNRQKFGVTVAVSGDTAVVGAPWTDLSGKIWAGAAYVFTRSAGVWTQQAKLIASDGVAYDEFGSAVAIDGDSIVVGARYHDPMGLSGAGAGYVFTRAAGVWSEKAKLLATAGRDQDQLGSAVALDGKTAILAAPNADVTRLGSTYRAGAVFVFVESGGVWTQQARLVSPGALSDSLRYGSGVALAGDTLLIAPSGLDAGHAFVRSGTSWSLQATLTEVLEYPRAPVAFASETGVFRTNNEALIFRRSGTTWGSASKVYGYYARGSAAYASGLAVQGDWLLVGDSGADAGTVGGAGALFAYHLEMQRANGQPCTAESDCVSGYCTDGVCCNVSCHSSGNECQVCSVKSGGAVDGVCGLAKLGTVCRPAVSICDVADVCDGSLTRCPRDLKAPTTTVCRATAGPCDVAEYCDGLNNACPSDRFSGSSTTCRAATAPCDAPETCTGLEAACPTDKLRSFGSECRAAAGPCDVREICTGFSADCPVDRLAGAGTNCRAARGICDVAESCSGTSADCPSDAFAPAATVCRASARDCDAAETCSGATSDCPSDTQSADGARCPTGVCMRGACMPQADLKVTLGADPQTVRPNQSVRFTAVLSNLGPGKAMPAVLTLAYPPTAALANLGGAGFGCMSAAGGAVCTLDSLAAGSSATLGMSLIAPSTQTVFNVSLQGQSAIPDPVPENNFVTVLIRNETPGPTPGPDPMQPDFPKEMPKAGGCSVSATPSPSLPWGLAGLLLTLCFRRRRARPFSSPAA